jgi:hypothetical protein
MLFDHVVARVKTATRECWIDATDIHRGGRPSSWTSLPFRLGLPIHPAVAGLVEIPEPDPADTSLRVRENLTLDSRARSGRFDVTVTAGGLRADWLRRLINSQGMPGLHAFLKAFMEATRRGVEFAADPVIEDDISNNIVKLAVRGTMHDALKPDPQRALDLMGLAPFSFAGIFAATGAATRKQPAALSFPNNIAHETQVVHPSLSKADCPREFVKNEAFELECGSRLEGGHPVYWFNYRCRMDRVQPAAYQRYRLAVERAMKSLDVYLHLPSARGNSAGSTAGDVEGSWGGGVQEPQTVHPYRHRVRESRNIVRFVGLLIIIIIILIRLVAALT